LNEFAKLCLVNNGASLDQRQYNFVLLAKTNFSKSTVSPKRFDFAKKSEFALLSKISNESLTKLLFKNQLI